MFSGKESEWTWNTSSGLSVSYGLVGGTGAQFVLNDPRGGTASFNYITVGVGASVGAKWSFGGSSTAMYSKGKVFISDSFPGNEFHNRDFEGFCLVADASASVIAGVSVDAMLLGIPAADVPKSILTDFGVGLPITAMATRGRSLLDDHPVLGVLGGISAYLETEAVSRVFANGTVADFFKSNAKALLLTKLWASVRRGRFGQRRLRMDRRAGYAAEDSRKLAAGSCGSVPQNCRDDPRNDTVPGGRAVRLR